MDNKRSAIVMRMGHNHDFLNSQLIYGDNQATHGRVER